MSSLNSLRFLLQKNALIKCAGVNVTRISTQQSNLQYVRCMSERKGFFANLYENIQNEMDRNKKFKESVKKFREDAQEIEQSDSLKKAREKYQAIEKETLKGSDAIKKTLHDIHEKVVQSEYAKKSKEIVEDVAESVSKKTENIAQTSVYKTISYGVKAVKEEIKDSAIHDRGNLYKAPEKLRKRDEYSLKFGERAPIKPDEETTNVVLNKNSQWYQSWQDFKTSNQVFEKIFDIKAKYDESDNAVIRATRTITDKVTELFGGVFAKTEMSTVLTEITKMDSSFDKENFLKLCQFDFIPNILEAMINGNLEVLSDWCHEAAYNVLAEPIKQAKAANYMFDNKVLDINNIDLIASQIMDQGPVLVVSFNAQQIMVVRDAAGKVIEGDPDKIMKVYHVWAFCRDQNVYDPKAAWKLIDLNIRPMDQWM